MKSRKRVFSQLKRITAAVSLTFCGAAGVMAQAASDLTFRRAAPVRLSELKAMKTTGVSVAEVSDYVFGNYQGEFTSPHHADINPRKAFVIFWRDFPYRFVFSHEASYCPWFEMPSGAAPSYQFFEGNDG